MKTPEEVVHDLFTTYAHIERDSDERITAESLYFLASRAIEADRAQRESTQVDREGGIIEKPTWPDGCPLTLNELAHPNGHVDCRRTPERIAQRVLDNHFIHDDWRRTGAQIRDLIVEAVELKRAERSTQVDSQVSQWYEVQQTPFGCYLIDRRDPENVTHVAILGEDWGEGEPA